MDVAVMDKPVKKTKSNLGDLTITGGPGRPKGSKNKFTKFKEDILSIWEETEGKERLAELIKRDKNFQEFIVKMVIPILPKDPAVNIDQSEHVTNIQYGWADEEDNDSVQASRLPERDTQISDS